MNLPLYKKKAIKKHKVHQGYLTKLKKKKPKNLDLVAQDAHDHAFENIDCLQCANCCKTTGPLFTEKDIERIAKYLKIKPQQMIAKYLKKDEDNDWVLQALPCAFLGSDNRCSIYAIRPKACQEFPHTNRRKLYQINQLTIKNTKICPAAYEVVEEIMKQLPL